MDIDAQINELATIFATDAAGAVFGSFILEFHIEKMGK